jgi:hypothetical protein
MPALPANPAKTPLPQAQFDTLSKMLESLIGLILPLHQLLEAQEGLETSITDRLEEIMEAFGKIAASLQITAEALGRIMDREAAVSGVETRLQTMETRQHQQNLGILAIQQHLQMLIDWLGAPPRSAAEPNS